MLHTFFYHSFTELLEVLSLQSHSSAYASPVAVPFKSSPLSTSLGCALPDGALPSLPSSSSLTSFRSTSSSPLVGFADADSISPSIRLSLPAYTCVFPLTSILLSSSGILGPRSLDSSSLTYLVFLLAISSLYCYTMPPLCNFGLYSV